MPIVVLCPNCPTKLSAPESAAGLQVRCPKCGAAAQVPPPLPVEALPVADLLPEPAKATPVAPVANKKTESEEAKEHKKKRREDDDDYEHDHRRNGKARKTGVKKGGLIAVLLVGGFVLFLGGGLTAYLIFGKGSLFGPRTPVPEGWARYSYPRDGFRAYMPKQPTHASYSPNGPRLHEIGISRGRLGTDTALEGAEGITNYTSGTAKDRVRTEVKVIRYKREVPEPLREVIENPMFQRGIGAKELMNFRSIQWLGRNGAEYNRGDAVIRIIHHSRFVIVASIGGANGKRATAEEEAAFFDNFDLVR